MTRSPRILIVGSGFGGIGLGYYLGRAGIGTYTLLEKSSRMGGTWRDNVYPGAACDVPSLLYCYSFDLETGWSRRWAPQAEILQYIERCAEKYGIAPHVRFETEVAEARWDGAWHVTTTEGEELVADVLVSAVGQLNRPAWPAIPGRDAFAGPSFHSATWDHGVDLDGKSVAVIGNAASAIQLVPEIAERARHVDVFQRSANWMLPRGDRALTDRERTMYRAVPVLARLARWRLWLGHELRFWLLEKRPFAVRIAQKLVTEHLEREVPDPELRRRLTPSYPIGAKRILISDDYYATLHRDHVRLITDAVERIEPEGVRTQTGELVPADVLVFATGFESTKFLFPMRIVGRDGRDLNEVWKDGPEAYLGMTVPGFPNFFVMYGPNTNLGHNSIIFMLECQARYIVQCIRHIMDTGRPLEPRPDVFRAYNDRVQAELAQTVWADIGNSWYKNAAGRIVNNWPRNTFRFWRDTRRVDFSAFEGAG